MSCLLTQEPQSEVTSILTAIDQEIESMTQQAVVSYHQIGIYLAMLLDYDITPQAVARLFFERLDLSN
jgi:hypothetical protein